jgi:hypothetical protein
MRIFDGLPCLQNPELVQLTQVILGSAPTWTSAIGLQGLLLEVTACQQSLTERVPATSLHFPTMAGIRNLHAQEKLEAGDGGRSSDEAEVGPWLEPGPGPRHLCSLSSRTLAIDFL